MVMTVEMYEQAVDRAMKAIALSHQRPIKPLAEKFLGQKPTRS